MSELIQSPNFDQINLKEVTLIDANAEIGATQITIVNETLFVGGNYILLGNVGQENTEVVTVQSIAGKIVTLSGSTTNIHLRGELFTQLRGNTQRLYRATNSDGSIPDDSAFSYINVFATIQGDDLVSELIDPTGGSGYWYKTTYYNTSTGEETSLANSIAVRGGNYGHLVSIGSIRIESGMRDATRIDDSVIAERRDQAESEVLGNLASAGYSIPLKASNGTLFTPAIVENIARLLTAGYLLEQDYGAVSDGDTKNGKRKIEQARQLLDQIQSQNIVLLDPTGTMLYRASQIGGWPDNTTQFIGTDGIHGEPFQMTMSKKF